MPSSRDRSLETLIEGLRTTPPSRLPYQANVLVRSFFLDRPAGNVVIYNARDLTSAAPHIRDRGGATACSSTTATR